MHNAQEPDLHVVLVAPPTYSSQVFHAHLSLFVITMLMVVADVLVWSSRRFPVSLQGAEHIYAKFVRHVSFLSHEQIPARQLIIDREMAKRGVNFRSFVDDGDAFVVQRTCELSPFSKEKHDLICQSGYSVLVGKDVEPH